MKKYFIFYFFLVLVINIIFKNENFFIMNLYCFVVALFVLFNGRILFYIFDRK
jgi:hypothetical protein